MGKAFPKISKAKDGLREAHMDVLVAVFGKAFPTPSSTPTTQARAPSQKSNSSSPEAKTKKAR
ncbi:hypothetical protein GCM10008110_16850 [Marinobacter persicus]|nr:hypothetical protein GCM10008110_16850 [Marinobacter persicus]